MSSMLNDEELVYHYSNDSFIAAIELLLKIKDNGLNLLPFKSVKTLYKLGYLTEAELKHLKKIIDGK